MQDLALAIFVHQRDQHQLVIPSQQKQKRVKGVQMMHEDGAQFLAQYNIMGNTLLDEGRKQDPVQIFEQWLEQNPDLVGRHVLSHNKLFESNRFKYCERSIKLAVFFRRDNTLLHDYLRIFQSIQGFTERYRCMHILPMRILSLRQFDKKEVKYEQNFAVAARQFLHNTLEQRLQARPFLSEQQKLWFIYQMVFSVFTIHEHFNIYHGNIRTSNFLITNYQYLLLTDFAAYKPTYILQDTEQGLSEFRLYYASSVERCNLAPEKLSNRDEIKPYKLFSPRLFGAEVDNESSRGESNKKPKKNTFEQNSDAQNDLDAMKRMDIFSLGLAILEVLSDGNSPLSYQQLVKSQKQGLNLKEAVQTSTAGLQNCDKFRDILWGMLQEDPLKRSSIRSIQVKLQSCIDQEIFVLFWCCLSAFNKTSFSSCDLRVHLLYSLLQFMEKEVHQSGHQFVCRPPKCLSGFNSLMIFAEMLEKGHIFAPKVKEIGLINRLLKHFEKSQTQPTQLQQEEEILFKEEDERRNFFIQSSKKSKIAKRLSFAVEVTAPNELCPPSFAQVQHLKEISHLPIKLTQLNLRRPRLEQVLQEYKSKQSIRQERLHKERKYKNCQIIIKVIFSCLRGCKYVASKLVGLELMDLVARSCSDAVLLKVLLPIYMTMAEDSDVSVSREAFLTFLNLFYYFVDPFHSEDNIHYFQAILQFFIGIIKQSKLRLVLFSRFKEVFSICQWLQVHYKRFNRQPKLQLTKLIEVIKVHYGSYSREEIRMLLNGNIPEHLLPDMFEFYISLINTDRLEGLRLSLILAESVSPLSHRHILDAFDSCIESGLDQSGMGLFYSIKYFTIRKTTSHFIIRKIAPHVINPNKWVRDEAITYIRMCLQDYPPTKSYFFFKDIFQAPFPLKPEDVEEEVLLPVPLRDTDIDLRERKVRVEQANLTINLFTEYLRGFKSTKVDRRREDEVQLWNQVRKGNREILNFQSYVKRQLQLLYQNNFLYYMFNMSIKFPLAEREKQQEKGYPQLVATFKKLGRGNGDLSTIDHEKKELFQTFEGTINSSFEKLLTKKNKDNGDTVIDKIKLAESLLIVGEVLSKFQMFKIRPIPRLGTYSRSILLPEKLPKPKGILLTQISQHTDAVTCLQKVADQFFLSGSSDGTLRVFDSKKIQMNMTLGSQACVQIRGQGEQKVKISSICAFQQTFAAVVGSSRGHIRIYPIERLPSRSRQDEIMKYNVNGELEKLTTLSNQLQNQCFCYVTAEGNLGVQDIRVKSRSMSCNIGRERGIPRALFATGRNSILVGTIDGYVVNFDIRYNVISTVLQLRSDKQALPVTGIYQCPPQPDQKEQLFAFTYPSRNYEYCCFDLLQTKTEFGPQRQYTSANPEEIIITPYFQDKTGDQQFKLCRNGLIWRKAYEQLSDFSKSFSIYDYLSDPLTRKEAKIREIWLDNCKNRYNQISSLYNKRSLPFLDFLPSGVLTSFNPTPTSPIDLKANPPFSILTEKREGKEVLEVERMLNSRPNSSHKVFSFLGEETKDYLTCCRTLPGAVVVGCRNSLLKVYV